MSTMHFNFARSIFHDNGILEVIPDQGIELCAQHIEEVCRTFDSLEDKIGILINRCNEYSHTFEAIMAIREACRTHRVAAYTPTTVSYRTAETVLGDCLKYEGIRIFKSREAAIAWLLAK